MIAAMANFMDYDVYDLELTAVKNNTELRKLFIETKGKSIIVVEDIDCSVDLTGKRKVNKGLGDDGGDDEAAMVPTDPSKDEGPTKMTLSGVLNFIDGLWSACGGERIIIFTTNNKDKLDPALIRRGRMDKHIEMSYCRYEAFKVLANNYLDITEHNFFERYGEIQQLLEEIDMSPADVAENMMAMSTEKVDAGKYLAGLVAALKKAKMEAAVKEVAVNAQEEAKVVVEKGVEKSMEKEERAATAKVNSEQVKPKGG
jgi:SpoVK/Ycf46/Vps4 family AAA+-type ATPase